jgi:hypothetical protein
MFDPDYTGTGHQPRYFDQYSAVYQKYKVFSSSCTIEMINFSGTNPAIFTLVPNTEIITFTNWQTAAELPFSKTSEIMPVASRYPFACSTMISTQKVSGLSIYQINDEDWSALCSTNPLTLWYWTICASSTDLSTVLQVQFRVRMVFTAKFYERLDVGTS